MKSSKSKFFDYLSENLYKEISVLKDIAITDFEKYIFNRYVNVNDSEEKQFDVNINLTEMFIKERNANTPFSGKANTIYGEILRGIDKLLYRYENDGDDIESGSYSGIWYGLIKNLYFPFDFLFDITDEKFVTFDFMSCYSCSSKQGFIDNIIACALIVGQYDFYNKENNFDISSCYDYLGTFIVPEDINNMFKKIDVDLTKGMTSYAPRWYMENFGYDLHLDSYDEDVHIYYDCYHKLIFEFYIPNNRKIFKFEITDENLQKYKDSVRQIWNYANNHSPSKNRNFDFLIEE